LKQKRTFFQRKYWWRKQQNITKLIEEIRQNISE
jgi:hypothetical protein